MNLLLVVPRLFNSKGVNYNYAFPLGLAYISAVLKQAGHDVDCLNMNHYNGTAEELIGKYLRSGKRYDHVLTGGLSNDYNELKEVVDAVRSSDPKAGVIMGGAIISSEPELMFNALKIDYAVMGEGEETICELIDCLGTKGDVKDVAGIAYRSSSGKFVCTKGRENIKDLESIPWPDLEGFEFEKYLGHMHPSDVNWYDLFDHPRVYPIICSRSCPFMCTFCFHPLGRKYRQRSVDSVMEELSDRIKRYRINIIDMHDDLFTNNRVWLDEFCRRIKTFLKELQWECKWFCQMRVQDVDDDILNVMKDAGCIMISYGFESYSPTVLKSMKKHITPQQIDHAIRTTLKHNISIQGNFIFGDVAETPATAKETLDYYRKNADAGISLFFVAPLPGSELYEYCVKHGIIKDRLDFIADHIDDVFNMSATMTEREHRKMWFDVVRARSLYRVRAKRWSSEKMPDGTSTVRAECPHCRAKNEYRNYLLPSGRSFMQMMYCRSCRYRFYIATLLFVFSERLFMFAGSFFPGGAYYLRKTLLPFIRKNLKFGKFTGLGMPHQKVEA